MDSNYRNLHKMAVFARVAELGSFTAAAEKLNLGKAVVSQHVSDLEHNLGVRLLNRTTRSLKMTSVGEKIYQHSRGMLSAADAIVGEADASQMDMSGTLRISAPVEFGTSYVVPRLAEFCRQHPRLEVDLLLNDEVLDPVAESLDVSFRIGYPVDSGQIGRKLFSTPHTVCASPDYMQRSPTIHRPEQLVHHSWLVLSLLENTKSWVFANPDGTTNSIRIRAQYRCNSVLGLKQLLLCGLGVTIIPKYFIDEELLSGKLVQLLPEFKLPEPDVYIAFLSRAGRPKRVRAFLDYIYENI